MTIDKLREILSMIAALAGDNHASYLADCAASIEDFCTAPASLEYKMISHALAGLTD